PETAFYGTSIPVRISGFRSANDGNDPVLVSFIETNPATAKETRVEHSQLTQELRRTIAMPNSDLADNTYRFRVRLTDHLGQASETVEHSVALTHKPNALRFFHSDQDVNLNLAYVTVGDSVGYQIEVVDKTNRRVPYQTVRWKLQEITAADQAPAPIQGLGETQADGYGLARINLNSALKAGRYKVSVELVGNEAINTAIGIRVIAGETKDIHINHIERVKAGDVFTLNIRSYDEGGNWTQQDSHTVVNIALPYAGFHFGFANGVNSAPLSSGGEMAEIRLHFGEAQVPIVASTTAGSYLADLETIDEQLTTYYDVNGDGRMIASDNLLVEVVAGDAFMINFVEESRTNLPLGDINRLEVGEQVTVAATLVDKYYNRIYEIDSQGSSSHADLQLSATVNGSAVINNIAQTADIALKQGYGTFQVTTEVTEQVDITGNTTLPQLPGLAKYAVLSLDFLKPYPAIEQSIVQPVVDSLINPLHFSYSEPVNNIGNELPLRITLEDNPVEGEFTLDGQKITFVPLQPLALARC